MPIYCFVPECKTIGTNGFHRFPADPDLKKKWMEKTGTFHLYPTKNHKICRRHFNEDDLVTDWNGKEQLAPNAVPSLFLPPATLITEHDYYSFGSTQKSAKNRRSRLSKSAQEAIIADDNVGNEVELGEIEAEGIVDVGAFSVSRGEERIDLGPYINIEYVRSLEEKLHCKTKENEDISRKLINKTRQVKRLKRNSKTRKLDDKQVLEYLRAVKKYSATQIAFEEMQLRNARRNPHGRRYTPKEKSICLALYKSGPRSYRFKEDNQVMVLPTLSTLGRHSAKMMFRTGICPQLFAFIKEKVKDWPESDLLCSFAFDETALKTILEYSSTNDEIIGFTEVTGGRRPIFATHALTFMVRGIQRPFKQPVAHFYTHGLKAFELAELATLVLEEVLSTGLNVIQSVSDQVKTNESAIHRLMDRDFKRTPGCMLKYKVGGKTIIHCYDGPHIVKVIRNNLELKNFRHFIAERWTVLSTKTYGKQQQASWDDVKHLYGVDKPGGSRRLLKKITDEHIKPAKLKMKVHVATQVFSQTYGNAMMESAEKNQIPAESCGTAQLLLFVNDFFDSINGSGPVQMGTLKGSINQQSDHFAFWEWALFMLAKMNFIDKITGEINNRSTVISKIESTIRGYQEVTRICLNNDILEVALRNTDSDGLENFFGCVKSCCQVSCAVTPRQFTSGYTTMILNNLMSTKNTSTNCEPDNSVALLNDVHELIVNRMTSAETIATTGTEMSEKTDNLYDCVVFDVEFTEHELNFFEEQSLLEAGKVIFSKVLERNECDDCQASLRVDVVSNVNSNTPSNGNANTPTPELRSSRFVKVFEKIYNATVEMIPLVASERTLKKILIDEIKKKIESETGTVELTALGCVEHNPVIIGKLFECTTVYAINVFCKNINALLTGKIKELPSDASDIHELALKFWAKKRIKKHSDIFIAKL